eukprot:Skav210014  [mRNA]  locus=scaffold1212:73393:76034:- [translate_table: standard]
MVGSRVFVGAGCVAAQLLPLLLGYVQPMRAAWGWTPTPTCAQADATVWNFDGAATLDAGASSSVRCLNGGTPSMNEVTCPESTGQSSPDNGWWAVCGSGTGACSNNYTLGTGMTCNDA